MDNLVHQNLKVIYPDDCGRVYQAVMKLIEKWRKEHFPRYPRWINEGDILMISYGDAFRREGDRPLKVLKEFMDEEFRDSINLLHLLPLFPFSSDDGFSVIDFREIDPALGTWDDIAELGSNYDLMFDAVINHASRQSSYFRGFAAGEAAWRDFFITADPAADYSRVIRPRTLPLLSPVETAEGKKFVWTTFSDDQIDFNYKNPQVLLEMLDILLLYARRGARFIRFDAVGFIWKEPGTSCMHLPQAHALVKLARAVLQTLAPGCSIITETNVPHRDNISYFGSGHDEAALVYQFPLPPLVLFSFLKENAEALTGWAAALEPTSADTAYFNFLASHDGIGLRPVEDILSAADRDFMARETLNRGGELGRRTLADGSEVPYELNINYLDAVAADAPDDTVRAQKFMASQCILLSMMGLPGIYYHSLLGSRGDRRGCLDSGIKRRINREKLAAPKTLAELRRPGTLRNLVSREYRRLIALRRGIPAFHPNSPQRVRPLAPEVFALERGQPGNEVLVLVNVSGKRVVLETDFPGKDLVSGESCGGRLDLGPWQYRWIKSVDSLSPGAAERNRHCE
jgi:sucrose phosphorylase